MACATCGFIGPVLHAHRPPPWWSYVVAMTGLGVVALVLATFGSRRTCARCGDFAHLQPTDQEPTPDALALWQNAEAADKREVGRRKALLLVILPAALCLLVAALVWLVRQLA